MRSWHNSLPTKPIMFIFCVAVFGLLALGCSISSTHDNLPEQQEERSTSPRDNEPIAEDRPQEQPQEFQMSVVDVPARDGWFPTGVYASPDQSKIIRVDSAPDPDTLILNRRYILIDNDDQRESEENDSEEILLDGVPNELYDPSPVRREAVIWLDNERVLLNGTWLLRWTGREYTKQHLLPNDAYNTWDYAIDPEGQHIAYIGKRETGAEMNLAVWVIALDGSEAELIFEYPPNPVWTSGIPFSVAWDADGRLYFDVDHEEKPAVYRWDGSGAEATLYFTGASNPITSPAGDLLVYRSAAGYYDDEQGASAWSIRDTESGNDVARIDEHGVWQWSSSGQYLIRVTPSVAAYDLSTLTKEDMEATEASTLEPSFTSITDPDTLLIATQMESSRFVYWTYKEGAPVVKRNTVEFRGT